MIGLIAAIATTVFSTAQAASFDSNHPFSKTISLHVAYLPLEDWAVEVSRVSGVKVDVEPAIRDRKIAVFCRDSKLSELMHRVSELLFGQWRPIRGGGWRLVQDPIIAKQEKLAVSAEEQAIRDWAAKKLNNARGIAAMALEEVWAEADSLRTEITKAKKDLSVGGQQKLEALQARLDSSTDTGLYSVGRVLRQCPDGKVSEVLNGTTLVSCTNPTIGFPLLDSRMTPHIESQKLVEHDGQKELVKVRSTGAVGLLRFDPNRPEIGWMRLALGMGKMSGFGADHIEPTETELRMVEPALVTSLRGWALPVASNVLDVALRDPKPANEDPSYFVPGRSIADQFADLFDRTGVPIIADSFRLACSGPSPFSGNSVRDWLEALRSAEKKSEIGVGYLTSREGWILYRHSKHWWRQRSEPPEKVVAPAEATLKKSGRLELDDYAAVASGLDDQQLSSIEHDPKVLLTFPKGPLRKAAGGLRLWASLGLGQRDQARKGLMIGSLSADQRRLFLQAIDRLIWTGSVDESLIPIVFQSSNQDLIGRLWFRVKLRSEGADPPYSTDREKYELDPSKAPKQYTLPDLKRINSGDPVEFVFGVLDGGETAFGFYLPDDKGH